MSFDGVFYIKKWCAEEERFFQFSKFLDQAILKGTTDARIFRPVISQVTFALVSTHFI